MTVILKPHRGGRPVVIDKPIVLVGRHPDCDLIITDSPKISRKHCCLALVNSRFVVRDLDSMNGVWVNQDRVEHSADIGPGDELMIGDVVYDVVQTGAAAAAELPREANPESIDLNATLDVLGDRDDPPAPRMDRTRVVGANGRSVDMGEVSGGGKIEFSGAMALPMDSQDDDFVVPLGDMDD